MNPLNLPNRYSLIPTVCSNARKTREAKKVSETLITKIVYVAQWLVDNETKRQFIYKFPKSLISKKSPKKGVARDNDEATIDIDLHTKQSGFSLQSARSKIDLLTSDFKLNGEEIAIVEGIICDLIQLSVGSAHSFHALKSFAPSLVSVRTTYAELAEKTENLQNESVHNDSVDEDLNKLQFCSSFDDDQIIVDYGSSKDSYSTDVGSEKSGSSTTSDEYRPKDIEWVSISNFNLRTAIDNLKEYIATWRLSSYTKWAMVDVDKVQNVHMLGMRYFVDVHFSKPVKYCPNPLAIAKVHFAFHVSFRLPKWYPIMVTYSFEGNKHLFYTHGDYSIRSVDFQRFYIDQIITEKISFYSSFVRISDCLENNIDFKSCKKQNQN